MLIPKAGDVLVWTCSVSTAAGVTYDEGDTITLIEPTDEAPFNSRSRVSNWRVRCKHFEPPAPQSIWSNIWDAIQSGYLVRSVDEGTHSV